MYRFLLRPGWLLLHVLAVLAVVVMVSAGFWQLRRLDERRDENDRIRERQEQPIVPIAEVLEPGDPVDLAAEERFRRVVAEGRYRPDDQVLLRTRDLDGVPGFWVYTPLDLGDGTAVAVNRGWIPARGQPDGSDSPFETPADPVRVEGILEQSYPGARPAGDRQTTIAHADLEWFDEQLDADLYPAAIRLQVQDPPPADDRPRVLDAPELSEGPHLSYAGQWFLFTVVLVVGYPVLLRRLARNRTVDAEPRPRERTPEPV